MIGPLEERDLHLIPRICKTLLIAGCQINSSCGIHVHFSSDPFDGRSLRRLIGLIYMYEPLLYRVLKVPDVRRDKFAKAIHEGFAREVLPTHRRGGAAAAHRSIHWRGGAAAGREPPRLEPDARPRGGAGGRSGRRRRGVEDSFLERPELPAARAGPWAGPGARCA